MSTQLSRFILLFPVLLFLFISCNRPISGPVTPNPKSIPPPNLSPTMTVNNTISATPTFSITPIATATGTPTISPTLTPTVTSTVTITATISASLGDSNYSPGSTNQTCFITATQFIVSKPSKTYLLSFPINGNVLQVGIYPDNGGSPSGQSLLASANLSTPNYGAFLSSTLAPGTYWLAIVGTGPNYTYAFDPSNTSPPTIATTSCYTSLPTTFPSSFSTGLQVPIYTLMYWTN